ncbi:hypothetical protein [Thermophilibacter sp.]
MGTTSQSRIKFEDYDGFVEKFKPKKTTDDCYTPPEVYEVIKDWACSEYGIDPVSIVRPFYPGGDYESFDYSGGKVVVDNQPFSILAKICEFYLDNDIPFFLFAPSLTAFSGNRTCMRMNHVFTDSDIRYENGAVVRTAFVTSYGDCIAQTAPELGIAIRDVQETVRKQNSKKKRSFEYPPNIVTAAMMQRYAHYGIDMRIHRGQCVRISKLDEQKQNGKTIFGSGLLVCEEVAARNKDAKDEADSKADEKRIDDVRKSVIRLAEDRKNARVWSLSDREKKIVAMLGSE